MYVVEYYVVEYNTHKPESRFIWNNKHYCVCEAHIHAKSPPNRSNELVKINTYYYGALVVFLFFSLVFSSLLLLFFFSFLSAKPYGLLYGRFDLLAFSIEHMCRLMIKFNLYTKLFGAYWFIGLLNCLKIYFRKLIVSINYGYLTKRLIYWSLHHKIFIYHAMNYRNEWKCVEMRKMRSQTNKNGETC